MAQQRQFPCKQCGAMLEFEPGTRALKCQYCGELNEIALEQSPIEELDFAQQVLAMRNAEPTREATVIHCDGCGAESSLPEGQASGDCPFCGRAVVATSITKSVIKPRSLLPFAIKSDRAKASFDQWLGALWFAPGDLKRHAAAGGLKGVYLPAWTFDCVAHTDYDGQRGEHYYVTRQVAALEGGKNVVRTVRQQQTRWFPASGRVQNRFDDLLVLADRSLPDDLRADLQGWDLPALVPYQDDFLSGFVAETYQVELPDAFDIAKQAMEPTILATIRSDIGGDVQQVGRTHTTHDAVTFKHVLLPVWLSAYRYRNRTFRFAINARTGRVFGQRPYSTWKIAAFVALMAFIAIVLLLMFASMSGAR
jgi:DNA-directed RNA polymerase subunit RPC12/RpoP